ncbi:uncharacterized protein LOC126260907, partial [Schistocerca nitens]|uniref:uncharacterized protein LOC126260907 n=1 Tax=Schistocerca nitens TaxID=7011 RepID=UPI002118BB86
SCSCGASAAGAAVGTLVAALVVAGVALLLWRLYWRGRRGKHLVLVTDSEAAGDQYAFDNPCFRDGTPMAHLAAEKEAAKEDQKARWASGWSPLGALVAGKAAEKRRAFDDSFIGEPHIRIVSLRSHDFTGLGFTVCGNMRDGIFVKDVLHRGPASESGRIAPGDRIDSVRISFRHMVFEDALTILSYASPYDVQLEVENATTSRPSTLIRTKRMSGSSVGPADRICHPFYRSQSIADLAQIGKDSLKRGHNMAGTTRSPKISKSDSFNDSGVGDYPTLKVTNSPKSSLARKDVTKPDKGARLSPTSGVVVKPERIKKVVGKTTVIANKSSIDEPDGSLETVNKYQKFGVRVLPESSDSLKNVSASVQDNVEVNKEQQTVRQGTVPDIVYTTAVEPERHQNEKNIMLEKVVTRSGSNEEDNNTGNNSSSNRAKHSESVNVKNSLPDDSVQTANSLIYDERAIDVGPVTEHQEPTASFKQDAKKEVEKLYSKSTDSDTSPEGTKEHNVKLFLSKGLQNLKEKLHPDRRKNNSSEIPSLSGNEVKNKMTSMQSGCFSSDSEEIDDDRIFSLEGESKKTEKKLRKDNSSEVKEIHCNFEVPTDIPEEVQRAAMAARSNRKAPAIATAVANASLSDLNKISDSKANESRKSLSEDSSSDYEAMPGIASDSLGRPPKRHNKRKAPLPPAEDYEGGNNRIRESGDPALRHKITGIESPTSAFSSEENQAINNVNGSEVPDSSVVGNVATHTKRNLVKDFGGCEDKSPETFTLVPNIPGGTTQKTGHDISGKDITNITVNINSAETVQSFVPKANVHGDVGNTNIHNGVIPADSSSSGTSTMETRNLDYDSVNISNTNSDSDSDLERIEADCGYEGKKNKKGGTTIELNSSHITIHHSPSNTTQVCTEIESESTRKAASLGDLSRLDTEQPMSILERAVSLDLAEGGTPIGTKKRKAPLPPGEDYLGTTQDGEEGVSYKKEPRLDGAMDTFQRQRLKKSSDWGTLEEALKQSENFLSKPSHPKDGKEFLEISKEYTSDELSDANSKLIPSNEFSLSDSQVLQEGMSKTRTSSHSLPDAVSQEFNMTATGTVNFDNTTPVKASGSYVSEPNEIKDQQQKMVLHIEADLQEGTDSIPGSQMNLSSSSDQQSSSGISYSLQPELKDTPSRPMRLASSKKVMNTDPPSLKLDSYKQMPSGVLSSTPLTKRGIPNKDQENSFMDIMNSSPISHEKGISLQSTAGDNQLPPHSEGSFDTTIVTDSRTHNISSDIASKSNTVSTTDPFMTATSSVQASIGGILSQEDLMWSKETPPPDLPTTPVPVLSQVSSFVPSSTSMTYITEIQVVTSDDGTKPKHTLSDISQSSGMSVPASLHLDKGSPKITYQGVSTNPHSSAKLEINEAEIDTSDMSYQQSKNNVTITAIKADIASDNATRETRQSLHIAPNNNTNSVVDRKGKLPRPPVPPRKSEILSLMSSNNVAQAVMHQDIQPSTSTVERPHTVTQSAQGDSSGRFITFSTLTPRGGLGTEGNVGRHNSSFEQWVFLDEGNRETPTKHNGLERAIGNVNDSPIMKHSSFLTFPNNGASRSQSVTHISFDTKKESTDN